MKKLSCSEIEAARTEYAQRVLPPLFEQIRGNMSTSRGEIVAHEAMIAENHFKINRIPSTIGHLERFCHMCVCVTRPHLHSIGFRTKEIIDEYNYYEKRRKAECWHEREARLKEISTWAPMVAAILSFITAMIYICLGRVTENISTAIVAGTGVSVGAGLMAFGQKGLSWLFGKKPPHQQPE